jgi:hypothetical protein
MPNRPYWEEAHGWVRAVRIGAGPTGVLVVGTDEGMHGYPGRHSRPWLPRGQPAVRAIAASERATYGLLTNGQLARLSGESWQPYAASEQWQITELVVSASDRVLVIAAGHLREFSHGALSNPECGDLTQLRAGAARKREVYVVAADGTLHRGAAGKCSPVDCPVRLQRVVAARGRVLGLANDGAVWRKRDGHHWEHLDSPVKYRPDRRPFQTTVQDLALSAHSSWALDSEGAVFLLSDES